MAIITIDKDNYITSYASGDGVMCENAITVDLPISEDELFSNFGAYKYIDGKIIKDDEKREALRIEALKKDIRQRREIECYSIINRGQLWYSMLSASQLEDLAEWYKAWLDATETLEIPEMPKWITED